MAAHDQIMKIHKATPKDIIASNKENYCNQYLESRSKSEDFTTELNMMATSNELDSNFDSPKDDVTLPTRVYLKDLSSRIVELALAKD